MVERAKEKGKEMAERATCMRGKVEDSQGKEVDNSEVSVAGKRMEKEEDLEEVIMTVKVRARVVRSILAGQGMDCTG